MRTIFINRPHFLVPLTGLEPVRFLHRGILSPLRLPIPPQRLDLGKVGIYINNN